MIEHNTPPNEQRNFVHGRIIGAVTGGIGSLISGGNPIIGAARGFTGGGRPGAAGPVASALARQCPSGYDGSALKGGLCIPLRPGLPPVRPGAGAVAVDPGAGLGFAEPLAFVRGIQQRLPFGKTGFELEAGDTGEAVMGGFGVPAMVPQVVGTIQRSDGSQGPILRCISGMVLAIDNLCYNKGIKGLAAFRKWKPAAKGLITAKDVRCLRRANTLRSSKTNKAVFRELGLGG